MTDHSFHELAPGLIRAIEDWPAPGVTFRDITPLLGDHAALVATTAALVEAMAPYGPIDAVAGVEARGFLLAPLVAEAIGAGLVPVRKEGKLPADTISESYALEYGEATIEVHRDAVAAGSRVLVIDDVLATGGTLDAANRLFARLGAEVVANLVLIEIAGLGGRERLSGTPVEALLEYS